MLKIPKTMCMRTAESEINSHIWKKKKYWKSVHRESSISYDILCTFNRKYHIQSEIKPFFLSRFSLSNLEYRIVSILSFQ